MATPTEFGLMDALAKEFELDPNCATGIRLCCGLVSFFESKKPVTLLADFTRTDLAALEKGIRAVKSRGLLTPNAWVEIIDTASATVPHPTFESLKRTLGVDFKTVREMLYYVLTPLIGNNWADHWPASIPLTQDSEQLVDDIVDRKDVVYGSFMEALLDHLIAF